MAELTAEIGRSVSASVSRLTAPLSARIDELLAWKASVGELRNGRDGAAGERGEAGIAGKDGAPGIAGKDGAAGINGKDGSNGIDGKDGANGIDGKDAPAVDLDAVVAKVFPLIRTPQDGRDGIKGVDGVNGRDGTNGRDGERGEKGADGVNGKDANGIKKFDYDEARHTLDIVMDGGEQFTLQLPTPPRGEKGEPGIAGKDGANGIHGKDGADGVHGKDGAPGLRGEKGDPPSTEEVAAAITKACEATLPELVRKHIDSLMDGIITKASLLVPPGRDGLPGRPGTPGEDGRDGAGIKDISIYQLDRRRSEVAFALTDGREVKAGLHMEGMVIDADVHRSGEQYEKGDAVTHSGSYWVAKCDTKATPGKSDDWRMVVKRGRDGKDAE